MWLLLEFLFPNVFHFKILYCAFSLVQFHTVFIFCFVFSCIFLFKLQNMCSNCLHVVCNTAVQEIQIQNCINLTVRTAALQSMGTRCISHHICIFTHQASAQSSFKRKPCTTQSFALKFQQQQQQQTETQTTIQSSLLSLCSCRGW